MDDLSLPEVKRLVDAAAKNGGVPLKLETKGRELDQMVPRENAERLVELLGDSGAEVQVRWQQTGHGLARGRGRGGHERGD